MLQLLVPRSKVLDAWLRGIFLRLHWGPTVVTSFVTRARLDTQFQLAALWGSDKHLEHRRNLKGQRFSSRSPPPDPKMLFNPNGT